MGVLKVGNTVPRAEIEPTSLAFRVSVLPIHHIGYLMSSIRPHSSLPEKSVQTTTLTPCNCKPFNTYNYIQAVTSYTHTQGRFNNHTVHSLYMIMVTATCVVGVLKMGNTVPRVKIEPRSLAFCAQCATITPHRLP